jgi:pimeloyl-ACP methyl ester carboxylesterase
MARIAREIQGAVRTIRYDRRGYARSTDMPAPFTVQQHIKDLVSIIGDMNVVLIGHSFGGNVALGAAEKLPNQVLGLSTYETPLSWMPWWSGQSAGSAAIASGPDQAAENFMIRLIGHRRWESLPERTKADRRREGPTLTAELESLREGPPWNPSKIEAPVIAGVGTKAAPHHRRGAEWIAEHIPNAQLCVLQDAGHGAPVSHSKLFVNQLVRPHLERQGIILQGS